MKALVVLSSLAVSLVACGQSENTAAPRDNSPHTEPSRPSVPTMPEALTCQEDSFVPTPAGDAILIESRSGSSKKRIFPFVENRVVKLAVSDAQTSCVDGHVGIARWGYVATPFSFQTGRDGEPRYSLSVEGHRYSVGKGRATPTLCGEKDDCTFAVRETEAGAIAIEFRGRDSGDVLWQETLTLPERPQFAPVFGTPEER